MLVVAVVLWASMFGVAETASFVGVWKGISVCQVKDSACHDEGAVYTVKKGAAPDSYEFSGNKVVGGQETFMGTLQCKVGTESDTLVCRQGGCCGMDVEAKGRLDEWHADVSGDAVQEDFSDTVEVGLQREDVD